MVNGFRLRGNCGYTDTKPARIRVTDGDNNLIVTDVDSSVASHRKAVTEFCEMMYHYNKDGWSGELVEGGLQKSGSFVYVWLEGDRLKIKKKSS